MTHEPIRGNFAEGQSKQRVKRGTLMGDYAAGQERAFRGGTVQPRGTFASGESKQPVDPSAPRGDFARGQRTLPLN